VSERLQKIMARAGLGSRRDNEKLIAAGRVRVNGRTARLGDKADPLTDRIEVDGQLLDSLSDELVYLKLHKPRGVISSLEDELEASRQTVRDLIPLKGHIYPVGRLDKQSEGLILMTNDGQLAHRLTHPRYEHQKEYEVVLEGKISRSDIEQWRKGVILDDSLTAPADIEILKQSANESALRITLREGRKRQIRRIAAAFGHPVKRLLRTRIGPLQLGDMQPAEWRHLSKEEKHRLRKLAEQPAGRN
jgi:pseudouridine synthase